MKIRSPFIQSFDRLPATVPVFPLARAVVLPGGELPLNIFEPRYLNMVQDAMSTHRLVGMIQPLGEERVPRLHPVGCAGRIVRYAETGDGRLEIVLAGVCRFRIADELSTTRGYRLVRPDWSSYADDYLPTKATEQEVGHFHAALRGYFERLGMSPDWEALSRLEIDVLVCNLIAALPLDVAEKQQLLEAQGLSQRLEVFTGLLESDRCGDRLRH